MFNRIPISGLNFFVPSNWKLLISNYSECLHCPIIHPGLQKLSHYMTGDNDPGCRGCMSWDSSAWDTAIHDWTRTMLRLRRDYPSLSRGIDAWPHVDDALVVRLREAPGDAVLVAVNVGDEPAGVPATVLAGREWQDVETGALVDGATVAPRGVVVLTAGGTVVSADGREG